MWLKKENNLCSLINRVNKLNFIPPEIRLETENQLLFCVF